MHRSNDMRRKTPHGNNGKKWGLVIVLAVMPLIIIIIAQSSYKSSTAQKLSSLPMVEAPFFTSNVHQLPQLEFNGTEHTHPSSGTSSQGEGGGDSVPRRILSSCREADKPGVHNVTNIHSSQQVTQVYCGNDGWTLIASYDR
eukprot:PhF_6_TR5104/c0_g1_i1/m.7196